MQNHLPLCSNNKNGAFLTAKFIFWVLLCFVFFFNSGRESGITILSSSSSTQRKWLLLRLFQADRTGADFVQKQRNHRNGSCRGLWRSLVHLRTGLVPTLHQASQDLPLWVMKTSKDTDPVASLGFVLALHYPPSEETRVKCGTAPCGKEMGIKMSA